VSAKHLVSRSNAEVLFERSLKIEKYCLSSTDIAGHKETERTRKGRLRACFQGALRGNSAFVNLANKKGCDGDVTKLMSKNFKVCVTGQPEFKREHAEWLSSGGRGEYLNLNDLPRSEDMFLRSEVSGEESMKVSGINLNVQGKGKYLPQRTIAEVGLYQINSSMREWASELTERLTNFGIRPIPRNEVVTLFNENREWVNDDTMLIKQCGIDCAGLDKNTCVALISNDKRQANQMARTNNVWVLLVDPLSVVETFNIEKCDAFTTVTPQQVLSGMFPAEKTAERIHSLSFVYTDTGALSGALSKVEREERAFERKYLIKKPVSCTNTSGVRSEMYDLEELPANSYLRFRVYTPEGLRGKKKKKSHSYSRSSSSSNYAWETSPAVQSHNWVTTRSPRKYHKK
jgi:hypothetical protein